MVLLSCFMCIFLPMCSLLVICFIVICKWVNGYWIRKGVTTLKPRLFFGNAIDVVLQRKCLSDSVKDFHNSLKEKGQPYGGYYFLMRPVLVVTDLELIKRILITDFEHFVDHPAYINDDEPLSNHIFSLKGDRWKQLRAKLTPAFTSSKLKMMLGLFLKCCKDLEVEMDKKIIKDDVVDIGSAMEKLIMDIIGSCAFGLECNSFKSTSSDFHKYGSRFFHEPSLKGSVMHILSLVVPEIFKYINVRVLDAEMTDFFTNLVNDMVKYREENNIIRKDLMHLLLQLKNDGKVCEEEVGDIKGELGEAGNVPLTSTELVSQCFVFFIAGVETTAFALTILMYELSTNQKIQDKVREEIIAVLKKNRGRITYEAILEMKYLHKCICGK
uniref:Cytochrome P450 n=1 Tax=Photinus pyralis TaxID=7054 RepID=A0A1Y1MPH2_PHOPY